VSAPERIVARDNALLVRLRRLVHDGAAYRRTGEVWLEGDHLCRALAERGGRALQAVFTEDAWRQPALRALGTAAARIVIVPDALFDGISTLPSPARMGFLVALPAPPALAPDAATLVLDRVQDAGNVGSLLRSAAAFGVGQVLALKGTAALWSPKVLRAGMGAHFTLALFDAAGPAELDQLRVPLVATSSHAALALPQAALPHPCAWVLGHEGQGVGAELLARCALTVRIPQPGGQESLNVAAAGAVCLYESARAAGGDFSRSSGPGAAA
jgi:TrmH family RNA methyltransferase